MSSLQTRTCWLSRRDSTSTSTVIIMSFSTLPKTELNAYHVEGFSLDLCGFSGSRREVEVPFGGLVVGLVVSWECHVAMDSQGGAARHGGTAS